MRLAATVGSMLGGTASAPPADFASLAEAGEGLPRVAGEACHQAADAYASTMRLQVRQCRPRTGHAWAVCAAPLPLLGMKLPQAGPTPHLPCCCPHGNSARPCSR